jgi:hypothetical protein
MRRAHVSAKWIPVRRQKHAPLLVIALSCGAVLALAGCTEDVGYVEVKVAPGFVVPPLALGSAKLDAAKTAVLRQRVGAATLQFERDGRLVPFCEFDVRKNRIVTVTVSAVGRDPRCKVQS